MYHLVLPVDDTTGAVFYLENNDPGFKDSWEAAWACPIFDVAPLVDPNSTLQQVMDVIVDLVTRPNWPGPRVVLNDVHRVRLQAGGPALGNQPSLGALNLVRALPYVLENVTQP